MTIKTNDKYIGILTIINDNDALSQEQIDLTPLFDAEMISLCFTTKIEATIEKYNRVLITYREVIYDRDLKAYRYYFNVSRCKHQ